MNHAGNKPVKPEVPPTAPTAEKVSKTLEQARQNVKPIVKKEQRNELVSEEMMAFRSK